MSILNLKSHVPLNILRASFANRPIEILNRKIINLHPKTVNNFAKPQNFRDTFFSALPVTFERRNACGQSRRENKKFGRNEMRKRFNWQILMKVFGLSLLVFGLFTISYAQPTKKFTAKFDKTKKLFRTPTLDLPGGRLVVSGVVRGVEVSGGGDGCFNFTVSTYRIASNGERILVNSRSRKVCVDITRLPELVIDRLPAGKYIIEVGVDLPRDFGDKKFEADINVTYPAETARP
jgi:hypothetical protein